MTEKWRAEKYLWRLDVYLQVFLRKPNTHISVLHISVIAFFNSFPPTGAA